MFSVVNLQCGSPNWTPEIGKLWWNHPEVGVKKNWAIPPYLCVEYIYIWIYIYMDIYIYIHILWHCRCSMDFPIKKTCSMDLFIKTFVFGGFFYHRSQKTHEFPHRWAQGAHLHRHCHQASKVSSCPWSSYMEKRGMVISPWWGILLMTVLIPTNGYKWWLNRRISLIQSSISALLWMCSSYLNISLSIPIHPYAYSIPKPQV